jgi:DNA-binding IclR family transcriptional regulator
MNRTIDRGFKILELLKDNEKGLTLKEISEKMNIPKTSTFDIVQSLLAIGMIERPDDDIKRYTIGIKLFALGSSYMARKNIYNVGNRYIKSLAEKLNKTTFIGVENNAKIIYIQKYEPKVTIKTSCVVGSSAEVYSTSLGKSILAFSSDRKRQEVIEKINFVKLQKNTIVDAKKLIKELDKTKKRGFSIDDQENEDGIFCIGAPIYDKDGRVIASLSASGLYKDSINLDVESKEVMDTALMISRELGYMGN